MSNLNNNDINKMFEDLRNPLKQVMRKAGVSAKLQPLLEKLQKLAEEVQDNEPTKEQWLTFRETMVDIWGEIVAESLNPPPEPVQHVFIPNVYTTNHVYDPAWQTTLTATSVCAPNSRALAQTQAELMWATTTDTEQTF